MSEEPVVFVGAMPSFRPLADRLTIRADPVPETFAGGLLHIPVAYRKRVQEQQGMTGTVVRTGPGMLMKNGGRWPMPCKPGDRVVFMPDGAQRIRIGGEELYVLRDDFVHAVFEGE